MKAEPSWDLYRSFLAVMRHGSLSGAARALGATQPTIGRHVDGLEEAFGAALFTRSPGGLVPTVAAAALMPHAEAIEVAAASLARAVSGFAGEDRGTVRIAASTVVGGEVLPPILRDLRESHPGIILELVLSNRSENLLRGDADIAVRMVRPVQDALVARHLGTVQIGLYASPDYVARRGLPRNLGDIGGHTLLGFDRDDFSARGATVGGQPITRELFSYRCDNDLALLAAVRAGVGIGAFQAGLARNDGLLHVLKDEVDFPLDVWLVMHEDLRTSRPVRLVYDHLAEGLTAYVARSGPSR